mmetsp:Transcript_13496/g.24170  ORF Transcript_13496/g.24170 Transcript_13496/m.24170 type:complete len:582 (+) Transcript_13496:251-1996(+)|eukprot:CAMPEP_0203750040 /NCGR_PEP_ID=MMETSP0098-20131031/4348_1 /ASSEMBLY_ACC=CAM_ASM_000208 /TAXON_ID=96639 /ORGANISM=" , Strain NY0313808BC1" /LENGTH=581 /DNA_ID=CAMNT_0050639171 /DNA_START=205 /DNA_END=1950 /DNA_ORIENTATION=-
MNEQLPGSLTPSAAPWVPGARAPSGKSQGRSDNVRHAPPQQHQQVQDVDQNYAYEESAVEHSVLDTERLKCKACEPLPQRRTFGSSKLPDELRSYFAQNLKATLSRIPLSDPRNKEVPKWFNSVLPLDDPNKKCGAAGTCGYPTSVFKVVNQKDGFVYALRRIDNVRGTQSMQQPCDRAVQTWGRVHHANVIPLRQAFVHQGALFLVHDYWPGAKTLLDYVATRGLGNLLGEKNLWSIATQLLSALRAAHAQKITFRGGVGVTQVLMTGRGRVRIGNAGLMNILESNNRITTLEEFMQEDIAGFARTMLMLCCMSHQALMNTQNSLEFVSSRYSQELAALISLPFQRRCSVYDLLSRCSRGLLIEIDELYSHSDALEENLCRQLETSRMNRLMIKLNLVNERPEYGKSESASWAETGDRYILKLFRDYVFHQTDDAGKPWLDMGHILTSLNKLDVSSPEKILLSSRDGRSILVVTFADVRKCLDDAFVELLEGHRSSQYYQHKRTHPIQQRAGGNRMGGHMHHHGAHPSQGMGMVQPGMMPPAHQGAMYQQPGMNPYSQNPYHQDQLYTPAHHHPSGLYPQ